MWTPRLTVGPVKGGAGLMDATSNSGRSGGVWPKSGTNTRIAEVTQRIVFILCYTILHEKRSRDVAPSAGAADPLTALGRGNSDRKVLEAPAWYRAVDRSSVTASVPA